MQDYDDIAIYMISNSFVLYTVYCKLFMVENFRIFCSSFDNRETFTVK